MPACCLLPAAMLPTIMITDSPSEIVSPKKLFYKLAWLWYLVTAIKSKTRNDLEMGWPCWTPWGISVVTDLPVSWYDLVLQLFKNLHLLPEEELGSWYFSCGFSFSYLSGTSFPSGLSDGIPSLHSTGTCGLLGPQKPKLSLLKDTNFLRCREPHFKPGCRPSHHNDSWMAGRHEAAEQFH